MTDHELTDRHLEQTREALSMLRLAIDALRREVTNPVNLAVMAEWTLDEIARLEASLRTGAGPA